LTHMPTGIQVTDSQTRSLNKNKVSALRKLRFHIAMQLRSKETLNTVLNLSISQKNPDYSFVVASVFDALFNADFAVSNAAEKIGVSTSKMIKFIAHNPHAWQVLNQERVKRNLKQLKIN